MPNARQPNRNDPCPCGSGLRYKKCCGRLVLGDESQAPVDTNQLLREGIRFLELGDDTQAGDLFRRILQKQPGHSDALQYLGMVELRDGKLAEAETLLRQAVESDPANDVAYGNFALLLWEAKRPDEAYAYCEKAISLNPDNVQARNLIAVILEDRKRYEEAEQHLNKAIASQPDFAEAYYNLASVLIEMGRFREAFGHIHKTIVLDPELSANRLLNLNYVDDMDRRTLFDLHRSWGEKIDKKCAPKSFTHDRDKKASKVKIRVGYLSPDFREHSVGYFIQHIIAGHDKSGFEVYCYANSSKTDVVSEYIESNADRFRRIKEMDDDELTRLIYLDEIDILVDLAGHTGGTRVAVMPYRPAPVQITYLGYPNTTGLATVDYRISDPYVDIEDGTLYTEKLLRLPECFLCFGRFEEQPVNEAPPFEKNGYITFGSFNNLAKLSPSTLRAWARVLERVPDSHLLIKAKGGDDSRIRENIKAEFAGQGGAAERLTLVGTLDSRPAHLDYYNRIDIALDTFPYNGTTTTCEALWMGVPVITHVGQAHAQRVSYSILKNVGIEETIAMSVDQYIEIAVRLAADTRALQRLRTEIPGKLRRSILCHPERFTRQLEAAYTKAWEEYLNNSSK